MRIGVYACSLMCSLLALRMRWDYNFSMFTFFSHYDSSSCMRSYFISLFILSSFHLLWNVAGGTAGMRINNSQTVKTDAHAIMLSMMIRAVQSAECMILARFRDNNSINEMNATSIMCNLYATKKVKVRAARTACWVAPGQCSPYNQNETQSR